MLRIDVPILLLMRMAGRNLIYNIYCAAASIPVLAGIVRFYIVGEVGANVAYQFNKSRRPPGNRIPAVSPEV